MNTSRCRPYDVVRVGLISVVLASFTCLAKPEGGQGAYSATALDEKSAESCQLDLVYGRSFYGVGCVGSVDAQSGADLDVVYYLYGVESIDSYRHFEIGVYRRSISNFIETGARGLLKKAGNQDEVTKSGEGELQLSEDELIGDCGQDRVRKVEVSMIHGSNWTGWMWEQTFAKPKGKLKEVCDKFTPVYRCVALVFGNDTLSAAMPTYCFLRKRVDNVNAELSFDVFMDMVKTIRFKEGSVKYDGERQ